MKIQPTLSEAQPSTTQQPGVETGAGNNPQTGDFFAMLAGLFLPQMLQKPLPDVTKTVTGADAKTVEQPTQEGAPMPLEFNLMPNWSLPLPVAAMQPLEQEVEPSAVQTNAKPIQQSLPRELPKTAAKEKPAVPVETPTYTDFDVPFDTSSVDEDAPGFADTLPNTTPIVLPELNLDTHSSVKIPDNINTTLTDLSQVLNQSAPVVQMSEPSNHLVLNTKEEMMRPITNEPVQIEFSPVNLTAVGKEVYNAQIKIHPPELGNIIAKLKLDKNGANLTILAENNVVKGIVEANLPALREHFQRADIQLNQIQVQVEVKPNPQLMTDQNREQRSQNQFTSYRNGQEEVENTDLVQNETKRSVNSLVDTYA